MEMAIDEASWEEVVTDRGVWWLAVYTGFTYPEEKRDRAGIGRRQKRSAKPSSTQSPLLFIIEN
jgi:hypothetical protein